MSDPSHEAQQVAIKMIWGIPILMMRKSQPKDLAYGWKWGRWRKLRWNEVNTINLLLMNAWRE
jgi:hypothetical protein